MTAVEEMTAEGVDFVFNTPNDNSRPGYLRMGWSTVGRLPLVVRVAGISGALRMRAVAGRLPTAGRSTTAVGTDAPALLADTRVATLLERVAAPEGLRTAKSQAYLRWRYGLPAARLPRDRARRRSRGRPRGVPPAAARRRARKPACPTCSCPSGAGAAERNDRRW